MCDAEVSRNTGVLFRKVHIGLRIAVIVMLREDITGVPKLSCQFVITEDRVHFSSVSFVVGKSSNEMGFYPRIWAPVSIILPTLHIHLSSGGLTWRP